MAAASESTAEKTSNKPKSNRFTQQQLPACKPLLTPKWVIVLCYAVGCIFIPIGAICLGISSSVVEVVRRYDDSCIPRSTRFFYRNGTPGVVDSNEARDQFLWDNQDIPLGEGNACSVEFEVTDDMDGPVFLYYELTNFFQNHRRYVKSRSDVQLLGPDYDSDDVIECDPQKRFNGTGENVLAYPCGLVAWSFFNDTYSVSVGGAPVVVNEKGIAWESDRKNKYDQDPLADKYKVDVGGKLDLPFVNNADKTKAGGGSLDPDKAVAEDEHFIVWMRTAALPQFRKLWGRIDKGFKKGDVVTVNIKNKYNTYRFDGQKKIVLSTASSLGGKNPFLGRAYIGVGAVSVIAGLFFTILQISKPRVLGDQSMLSWANSGQ